MHAHPLDRLPLLAAITSIAVLGCATATEEPAAGAEVSAAPRAWSIEDTLDLARVGGVAMSPDGAWVLYSESRLNWEQNGYDRAWYLISSQGGAAERRDDLDGAGGVRFTPDGARISYLAEHDDADQVFTVGVGGGRAVRVTDHPGGVDQYEWSPAGGHVYFTAEEPRDPEAQEAWDAGGDAVLVGEDGNGIDAQRWSNLWVHDLSAGEEQRLSDLNVSIGDMTVSPDGAHVVFSGASDNRTNYFWRSELYIANRRGGMVLRLTRNDAPEESPSWSPNGRWVAYHSPDPEWYDLRHGYLWLMNPFTGDARRLEGQHQGEMRGFHWAPDGESILFGESRGVRSNLYELDIDSDTVSARTDQPGTLSPRAFADDGSTFVYSYQDHTTPPDLWVATLDGGAPTRLTDSNPWVGTEVALAPCEVVNWTSTDERPMEGVLTLPPGWDGAEPLPLIMDIHGGPPGYWGAQLEREHQLYAARGYAVFAPNPRGSSSYGDDHLRALMGDVGGGEYEDLMTGVDHLVERGVADPERLALRGWSWGGILGAWTITQTDRFRAASLGAMVGDWAAEIGGGLMYDLRLHYIQSAPWEEREEWAKRSAQTYVENVKTPTILLHGERDGVSTVNQSQMFYTALRERDVPVRFVKFPRQGHGIREPRLERIALEQEIGWFEQHVLQDRRARSRRGREVAVAEEASAPERGWLDQGRALTDSDLSVVEIMERSGIPGLSAAVVKDGAVVWSGAFGWADVQTRTPVREDTMFQIASISKTVTGTVVMQLVEAGDLDLDADVNEVLPFPVRHPAHPDIPITTRMLLTHTAALRDNWTVLEGTWVVNEDYPMTLLDSVRAYFAPGGEFYSAQRSFQNYAPGTRQRYANVGFALAALVAETCAGAPFEQLARERVLQPLGIEGGFRLADVEVDRVAMPQGRNRDGGFEPLGHHAYLDFASGTLRVSAPGLARFLIAATQGGELDGVRILSEETAADMLRVQLPEVADGQGLAWYQDSIGEDTYWGHDGGDPGVATQMYLRPSDGVGFVLFLNGEARGRGAERALVEQLLEIGANAPPPPDPEALEALKSLGYLGGG